MRSNQWYSTPERRNKTGILLRLLLLAALMASLLFSIAGCGSAAGQQTAQSQQTSQSQQAEETKEELALLPDESVSSKSSAESAESAPENADEQTSDAENASESASESAESAPAETEEKESVEEESDLGGLLTGPMDPESPADGMAFVTEDGEYTSKEQVAAYLHEFGHLPDNYITKREAEELGWVASKGNLWKVAPGKSIGGSRFGNYEGLLPDKKGRKYYECDIDFDGSHRGAKRIVYSNDGLIFYTDDHYKSFEQLY